MWNDVAPRFKEKITLPYNYGQQGEIYAGHILMRHGGPMWRLQLKEPCCMNDKSINPSQFLIGYAEIYDIINDLSKR